MSSPVGSLLVRIGSDTSGLRRGGRQAETTLSRLGRQSRQTVNRLGKLSVAATAAGAALTAALVKRGMQAVDEQVKLSRALGGTIDALRGTQIAANDAGVASGTLSSAMERLNQRIGEARRGSGTGAEALDRLGLSAERLSRMDIDERMATVADAIREKGLSADQAADELRQLGIRNREMVDFMRQGGDAIRDARGEVDDFGLSINAVDAAQVEAANDAMQRIGRVIEHVTQRLAIELAPIIQGVSELFSEAAKETGGFSDEIGGAVDYGVRAFAFLADAVESVRRVFVVAGQAVATLALQIQTSMLRAADTILAGPVRSVNALIQAANKVPGIDFGEVEQPQLVQGIQAELALGRRAVEEGKAAMHETLMEPLPGEGIREWAEEAKQRSRDAAEAVVEDREMQAGKALEIQRAQISEEDEMAQEQAGREREQMEKKLERLREHLMSAEELEQEAHEERMEWLDEAHEAELIKEEEFEEKKEALERAHMERMQEIREQGMDAIASTTDASMRSQVASVANGLADMTSAMASESRAAFEINKTASMAQATMKGWEAAQSAWAAGMATGGPAAPAVAAAYTAASLAKTGAQLSSISSQSFSRGGSSQSAGGGGSGVPSAAQGGGGGGAGGGGQQVSRSITIRGEGVSQEWIRDSLVPALNEAAGDGASFQG